MSELARWRSCWIAAALALWACGGGGKSNEPMKFTPEMVQGKTFFEDVPGRQKSVITYASAGDATWWLQRPAGLWEIPGTWSIDPSRGNLIVQSGSGRMTIALVADGGTYFDVSVDAGTGATSTRLHKTIPFGGALQDRFTVVDRDLAGVPTTAGVADFESGAGVVTDGFGEDAVTWDETPEGSVALSSAAEDDVLYLRADSVTSSPKTLRVVGRRHDGATAAFAGIVDAVLTETPAKSGFTAGMVEGKVVFREGTGSRSIIHYATGGVREEWYEHAGGAEERLSGTWEVTAGGSLAVTATPSADPAAAMLVEAGQTRWDMLVNDGTVIGRAGVTPAVAATAAGWPGAWALTEHLLDGTHPLRGTVVLHADGTGTDTIGQPLSWAVQGDGSILVSWASGYSITYHQLATSMPPNQFELAGIERTSGVYGGMLVATMTR